MRYIRIEDYDKMPKYEDIDKKFKNKLYVGRETVCLVCWPDE